MLTGKKTMAAKADILSEIETNISTLPPEALQLVADLVSVLNKQYVTPPKKGKRSLEEEPFVGMWADRADMTDSTAYVRKLRQEEWT